MTADEMVQNYADIRRRLMGKPATSGVVKVPMARRDYLCVQRDEMFDEVNEPRRRWRDILNEVAEKHGLQVSAIKSHTRQKSLIAARFEAYYRIRKETNLSLPEIGMRMGGFDHASVLHGIRKHEERLKKQRDGAREALAISSLTDTLNQ